MARKNIAWILEFTSKLPNQEEQIKCLQENDNSAIRTVLRFCFDPNIKWLLPEGEVPYRNNDYPGSENTLYHEARRLYLFVEGGNTNLKQLRRESMFIELMEALHPDDAALIKSVKDKKFPYPGLTAKTVLKAYPGLF